MLLFAACRPVGQGTRFGGGFAGFKGAATELEHAAFADGCECERGVFPERFGPVEVAFARRHNAEIL